MSTQPVRWMGNISRDSNNQKSEVDLQAGLEQVIQVIQDEMTTNFVHPKSFAKLINN